MVNKKLSLKLIDGIFNPPEASKVLSGLINYKLNYHGMELFSNEERFGKDLSNSKIRIEQLKEVTTVLNNLINLSSGNGQKLKINCSIDIIIFDHD